MQLTAAAPNRGTAASRRAQEPAEASQSELRTLKQEMESAPASDQQLDRYHRLLTQINPAKASGGKRRQRNVVPMATAGTFCIAASGFTAGGPTFSRPQLQSAPPGFVQPCVTSMTGSAVFFNTYEFN